MAAGILANRHGIEWYGPRGQAQSPNWYGCLTQLHPDDTLHYGIGYRDQVAGLADASLAAIGGWVRVCWLLEQSITTGDCVSRFLLIFSRSLSSFHACLMALAHQQLFFCNRIFDPRNWATPCCAIKFSTTTWSNNCETISITSKSFAACTMPGSLARRNTPRPRTSCRPPKRPMTARRSSVYAPTFVISNGAMASWDTRLLFGAPVWNPILISFCN